MTPPSAKLHCRPNDPVAVGSSLRLLNARDYHPAPGAKVGFIHPGKRDQLLGRILKERHGITKEEAEKQVKA